ncbi:MAG: thioredoxin [Hyphomicrobium sp.]
MRFGSTPQKNTQQTNLGGDNLVKDTTTAGFAKDVIEASRTSLVLVDFWAAWCGPCKQLAPLLEKVVRSYGGRVKLVKLDTDAHPTIAAQLRVQSLPTVYAFRDGRPLDGFVGVQSESLLKQFIDRLIGGDDSASTPSSEDIIGAATKALDDGDVQTAAEMFSAILQEDQTNHLAIVGLARCYLKTGDAERAQQMVAILPPDKEDTSPVKALRAALDLASKAGNSEETAQLESKVLENPADHQARFELALALAASGYKSEALEHLVEIVRRDRKWNDEAARKQIVQLFDIWGPNDEFTIEGRKRLASILFA